MIIFELEISWRWELHSQNASIINMNFKRTVIKNENEVVLRLFSNMIGYNETNFPQKLLLTNRQVLNLRKVFANNSSTDIKLSKTQLSKII